MEQNLQQLQIFGSKKTFINNNKNINVVGEGQFGNKQGP